MSQSKRVRNKKEKRRISLETVLSNLEDSIKRTKFVIISSLKCLTSSGELCIDFVTNERLARPPFPFIHALIVIYNRHLSFANGLYSEFDLELENVSTRQERIKFLFKIFVCVAMITHVRVDIYVSPAKLLGGQEVTASHLFLRCLAKASKVSSEQSSQVAEEILKLGESTLYKQSVKTRNMIVKFQAIIRGWLARTGWYKRSHNVKQKVTTCIISDEGGKKKDSQEEENCIRKGAKKFNSIKKTTTVDAKNGGLLSAIVYNDCSAEEEVESAPSLSEGKNEDKCTPIEEAVGINKIEWGVSNVGVEEDRQYHTGSGDNKQRNMKQKMRQVDKEGKGLKKICHKPADSTYVMKHGSGTRNFEDKLEEKSKDECRFKTKLIKKLVISNGVVTHQTKEVREVVEDRNEADTDTRLKVISEREVEINKRMERLKDREAKLKIRIEETKQKEMHLELYENRVKRLAEILRKQQDKMKEDEARRTIELDELRVQTISSSYRMPNITLKGKTTLPNEFHFSDELLRQACYNPTITDLRLGLERKERQLRTRYANLLRAEKDLQSRTKEFERNCASSREILEMQSVGDSKLSKTENVIHTFTREKNKRKVNKGVKENMTPDSSIPGDSNIPDNTISRRDAFVPATLPNELKARTSAPKTRKEGNDQSNKHVMTSKSTNSVPLLNVSDEKKNVQLSRRHSLPRSLIEYTKSHV